MNIAERLAEFTVKLVPERVPASVAERAKHLILDAVGLRFRGAPRGVRRPHCRLDRPPRRPGRARRDRHGRAPAAARRGPGQRRVAARPRLRRHAHRRRAAPDGGAFSRSARRRGAHWCIRRGAARSLRRRRRGRRAHRRRGQGRPAPGGLSPDGPGRRIRRQLGRRAAPQAVPRARWSARRASRSRSPAATCSFSKMARGRSACIRAGPRRAASLRRCSRGTTFLHPAKPTKDASACSASTCRRPSWPPATSLSPQRGSAASGSSTTSR